MASVVLLTLEASEESLMLAVSEAAYPNVSAVPMIIGMFDFKAHPPQHVNPSFGISERVNPGTAEREAEALRAKGSNVHVTIANPDPQTDFMDPATIGPALSIGRAAGKADAPAIAEIWK